MEPACPLAVMQKAHSRRFGKGTGIIMLLLLFFIMPKNMTKNGEIKSYKNL